MKRLMLAGLLAGTMGMLPHPQPADASPTVRCMLGAVRDCNNDFPTHDIYLTAARGYCYAIRAAICRIGIAL